MPSLKDILPIPHPPRRRLGWLATATRVHHNHVLRSLLGAMGLVGLYTAGAVYVCRHVLGDSLTITVAMHSILGVVLGLLLVIRSNSAYDRWWEGRRLVGELTNNARNLALKLAALLPPGAPERRRLAGRISAYALVLKAHLRAGLPTAQEPELAAELDAPTLAALQAAQHPPNRLAKLLYDEIEGLRAQGRLTPEHYLALDKQLEALTNIAGGCERIRNTPLPLAYAQHLKTFVLIYVSTLPFGLQREFGYYAVPAVMLIFYAMAGMELIAEEIEDPFGRDENDIPMDAICAGVRTAVHELLLPNTTEADPDAGPPTA